jgi:hypothetical protein
MQSGVDPSYSSSACPFSRSYQVLWVSRTQAAPPLSPLWALFRPMIGWCLYVWLLPLDSLTKATCRMFCVGRGALVEEGVRAGSVGVITRKTCPRGLWQSTAQPGRIHMMCH